VSEPIETLVVTFFEHPCLTARLRDGAIVVSIRDLCDAVGLNLSSQLRRLNADEDFRAAMHRLRVPTASGLQEQDFLRLEEVPLWMSSANRSRSTPVVQERLRYLRRYIVQQVHDAIAEAAGLPGGSSRNIEDLRDLRRYDEAIAGLAERTKAMEESQEKARQVWRDLEARVRRLEAERDQKKTAISSAQRGHIYQLVQIWADARVKHHGMAPGAARAGCWAALKGKFKLSHYEDLPAAKYHEAVTFIRDAYQAITGESLTGDQLTMDV
jgi:P22_AR N-terminal domain